MTRGSRTLLGVLLASAVLAGAALLPAVPAATAATPCWKALLNDWYDGRIDHTYPISCYHQALKHLPTDVQTYSSAKDDISRALQDAVAAARKSHRSTSGKTLVPPQTTPKPPPPGGSSTVPADDETTTTDLPGNRPRGGISKLADDLNPSSPSSLPVPLLVLGGLALLLVALGGVGLIVKRRQNGP